MKDGKKRDKGYFLVDNDNRDNQSRIDVRAIIIFVPAGLLGLLILGLAVGGSGRKKTENAVTDILAEEFDTKSLTGEFSDDSDIERPEEPEQAGQVSQSMGNIIIDARQEDMGGIEEIDVPDLSGRYICFAGYEDCSVGEGEQMVLVNLPENEDIYIAYTVYLSDTGEAVFETGLIAPGNSVGWTVSGDLEPGEYRLSLYQVPYILDNHGDFVELISASNEMTIVVNY